MGRRIKSSGLTITATALLVAGLGLATLGVVNDQPARATGGTALIVGGFTCTALAIIRRWITNTSVERRRHLDAARDSEAERMRYIAAMAALEIERDRLRRDAKTAAQENALRFAAECAKVRDQFEGERARVIAETFETAVKMVQAGLLEQPREPSRVIDFPSRYPQPHPPVDDRGVTRS